MKQSCSMWLFCCVLALSACSGPAERVPGEPLSGIWYSAKDGGCFRDGKVFVFDEDRSFIHLNGLEFRFMLDLTLKGGENYSTIEYHMLSLRGKLDHFRMDLKDHGDHLEAEFLTRLNKENTRLPVTTEMRAVYDFRPCEKQTLLASLKVFMGLRQAYKANTPHVRYQRDENGKLTIRRDLSRSWSAPAE